MINSPSFAHRLAVAGTFPNLTVGAGSTINIGFLAPLSGQVESWGLPGLHGCRIWESWLNNLGGILIRGQRYPVRIHAVDCQYDPRLAIQGATELVQKHDVQLLMMLGGDTYTPVASYLTEKRVLTSTLLPSDLSPDSPYLIAPSEAHPIYVVTGVDWIARQKPHLKTVSMCSQKDAFGLPGLASYRAAFKAAGINVVKEIQYDENVSAAEIVAPMLAESPDILCWCCSYTPMVHAMTEYAYAQGYQGQIISCTVDYYNALVEKTSKEFLEGMIFQFPDFDDPALRENEFFFNQPDVFYEQYNALYPRSWSAVSWEYAVILDIWHAAVQKADTVNSVSVMAAMKQLGEVTHAFGLAKWWGEELFGISNALVGDWPVVAIEDGKAKIVEFGSLPEWLDQHGELLRQEMLALGQTWEQRIQRSHQGVDLGARGITA